jgi:hypothetical protein
MMLQATPTTTAGSGIMAVMRVEAVGEVLFVVMMVPHIVVVMVVVVTV